jgi:DNA-binding NarL/FixJ family response regulator
MEDIGRTEAVSSRGPIDTVVISEVRFLRECLAEMLTRDPAVRVREGCATPAHALAAATALRPGMVLLDGAFPNGAALAFQLRGALPQAKIVAIALEETEETVLAWAEAGITGYVSNTTSLSELSALLRRISWGEQFCSSRIAGALLRRIGAAPRERSVGEGLRASLTGREQDILRLVGAGLTNKDIARRLDIGVGTTKAHVHNILRKLKLSSRLQIAVQMNRSDDTLPNGSEISLPRAAYIPTYTQPISSD